MFRRNHISDTDAEEEGDDAFSMAISDLMAALLAIFILTVVWMMIQLERQRRELEENQQRIEIARVELIKKLQEVRLSQAKVAQAITGVTLREQRLGEMLIGMRDALRDKGISVSLAENDSVLRINEDGLSFALGSHEIPLQQAPTARAIGEVLQEWLSQEERRRDLDTVFVEGHTDAVPNLAEMGNWGLSTYRAISLWRYWTESPAVVPGLASLTNLPSDPEVLARPLISVSGYGETRPVTSSTTSDIVQLTESDSSVKGTAKDRRIDIRFTLSSIETKPLDDVYQELKNSEDSLNKIISNLEKGE